MHAHLVEQTGEHSHVKPAVNRQPGFRRETRRAERHQNRLLKEGWINEEQASKQASKTNERMNEQTTEQTTK